MECEKRDRDDPAVPSGSRLEPDGAAPEGGGLRRPQRPPGTAAARRKGREEQAHEERSLRHGAAGYRVTIRRREVMTMKINAKMIKLNWMVTLLALALATVAAQSPLFS